MGDLVVNSPNSLSISLLLHTRLVVKHSGPHPMGSVEAEAVRKLQPLEFYRRFTEKAVRPDGRVSDMFRETTIATGTVSSAIASSMVRLGNTTVLAGVKAEISPPSECAPDSGI